MKKLFWALLSVLLVTTLSCGKQPEPTIDPSGDSTQKTDSGDPSTSDDPSSISDPSGDDGPVDDGPTVAGYECMTYEAKNVTNCSAKLCGEIKVKDSDDYEVPVMFCYSSTVKSASKLLGEGIKVDAGIVTGGRGDDFDYTVIDLEPGTTYYYVAALEVGAGISCGKVMSFNTLDAPEGAVDLGVVCTRMDKDGKPLKDGQGNEITYKLYWGECNFGASTPEGYGDYYTWGEVETHYRSLSPLVWKDGFEEGYSKNNYKWFTIKDGETSITKYWPGTYGDNKTVLETGPDGDDVASVNLGGKWRIPTYDEWIALWKQCTWEWDYERGGMVISSKAEGNSNSIYLPGTDFCVDTQVGKYAGERGNYWSSTLYKKDPLQAYSLLVVEKNSGRDLNGHNRYLGFSVRPVTE